MATLRVGQSDFSTRSVQSRAKDYDAIPDNDPLNWKLRFVVDGWVFLAAYAARIRIAGAVIVTDPAGIEAVGGRPGHAVLWDLRVSPVMRGLGLGRALLAEAESEAQAAGHRGLDVETQDVNVAACRLYARSGFVLTAIEPDAYPDAPGETRLVWTRELAG
jgi:ribosomal protein S18 acetylase RimI-like enzyme